MTSWITIVVVVLLKTTVDALPFFGECGCASVIPPTFVNVTSCPLTSYSTCNPQNIIEQECILTCNGPRDQLVYQNATTIWKETSSLTCGEDGKIRNAANATISNLRMLNCAQKKPCDKCNIIAEDVLCPQGMMCNTNNLDNTPTEYGCAQIRCLSGSLNLYQDNLLINYTTESLSCTTNNKWTNSSSDGINNGIPLTDLPTKANCAEPVSCGNCTWPQFVTNQSYLPYNTRSRNYIVTPVLKEGQNECREVICPEGSRLYGFNGTNNVNGLIGNGRLKCNGGKKWIILPLNVEASADHQFVCLVPCVEYAPFLGNYTLTCDDDGTAKAFCPVGYQFKIGYMFGPINDYHAFDGATFIPEKGWLATNCTGGAELFNIPERAVYCV